MQEVSQEWLDNQEQLLTSPAHIKIEYLAIDPEITALSTDLGEVNWADNYNEAGLNGYFYKDPTTTPPKELPKYTINFSKKVHPENTVLGLKFVEKGTIIKSSFDGNFYPATFDEYAVQFNVYVYNGETLLETQFVRNSSLYKYIEISSTNYDKIEIVFIQWSVDLGYAYIESAYIESEIILTDNDIISMNCSESIELNSFALPKNEFKLTLNNADENYNPDNPQSVLNSLNEKQELKVYFGYDLLDENQDTYIEWIDGGIYFITDWDIPQNGITATFNARDGIASMNIPFNTEISGDWYLYDGKYQPVEYIYSNGTGYINSNYIAPAEEKISEIMLDFSLQNTNPQTLFGCTDGTNFIELQAADNGYLRIKYLTEYRDIFIPQTNTRYEFRCRFFSLPNNTDGDMLYAIYDEYGNNIVAAWFGSGSDIPEGNMPNYSIYFSALNNNGTPQNFSKAKIYSFGISCEENSYYIYANPCYDIKTNIIGMYSDSGSVFYEANNYNKGDNSAPIFTLYDLAYSAFYQSQIPNNYSNSNIYEQYLSEELKKYPVNIPDNYNRTCAETVQLCANAAKCVWYFDRKGLSHIEPFDIGGKTLPAEYQQVTYLSFTLPTSYVINLGIYPTDTTTIRIKFRGDSDGGITVGNFSQLDPDGDAFRFFNFSEFFLDYGSGFLLNRIYGGTYDPNKVYNLEIGNRYIKDLDTNEIIISGTKVKFSPKTYTLYFASNFNGILVSLEIYQDNVLVGDFIPCYRISDNDIGLYNLVTDTFCNKVGTGTVGIGENVIQPTPTSFSQYVIDKDLNAYSEGEYSLIPELKEININDGQAVYKVANNGETQTMSNELIQDPIQAMQVAEWTARTLKKRKSVSGEYRPDPRADVLDKGTVKNKYADLNVYFTELNYSFNGAFKGTYTAKVKD